MNMTNAQPAGAVFPTGSPPVPSKVCRKCRIEKPVGEFARNRRNRDGFDTYCRACNRVRTRIYRDTHPGSFRPRQWRRLYGITVEDYERLLANQGGKCAICGSTDPHHVNGILSIDHDHTPKADCHHSRYQVACKHCIRGLLCLICNRQLKWFEDYRDSITAHVLKSNRPLRSSM